jgi:hypothetical protein
MSGVVRRDRDDIARVGRQNRLRREDGVAIERRRVGRREPPFRTAAQSSAALSSAAWVIGSNSKPVRTASSRRSPDVLPARINSRRNS